jgi:hypothetical protein
MDDLIWIDTETGTWGALDGLMVVNVGSSSPLSVDDLDEMSDSEINEVGKTYGLSVPALLP